jgi:hypothetical protein
MAVSSGLCADLQFAWSNCLANTSGSLVGAWQALPMQK